MVREVKIGNRIVGDGHPTLIVAEMAWGHDGSIDKAKKIIDIAADGGAEAINMHITSVADYIVRNYGLNISPLADNDDPESAFNYLENINLSFPQFAQLADYARSKGLLISTMINDDPSLDFAVKKMNPDILMIHPSCVGDLDFLARMACHQKVLLLYVGGLSLGEIETAVNTASENGCRDIILQHGFQSYPTPIEENNLRFIATLKTLFGLPMAFGDHTDGSDEFALVIPSVAVGMGANVIEKHLTHDRELKGEDFESALDWRTFAKFVKHIRDSEVALGSTAYKPLGDLQLNYRDIVRKRAVAAQTIPAGTVLTPSMVLYKRSKTGLYPEDINIVIGRATKVEILRDGPIVLDDFTA